MSQEQLADCAQLDRAYLSRIENNQRPGFGSDILHRLATCLQTSADYVLGLSDVSWRELGQPLDEQPDDLPENYRFLYKRIEHLPAAMRDQAIDYLIEEIERMEKLMQLGRRLNGETAPAPA